MGKITECFLEWDIEQLSEAYSGGIVSPVKVVEKLLKEIEKESKSSNTFITVAAKEALEDAAKAAKQIKEGNKKSIFHGIPIVVKDLIDTKDIRTTMGSEIFKDRIPSEDATVIKKLKEAGAIIIGKTNTHEFAYGASGDRSYFGLPVNPYDATKMCGGSSNGSGVALANKLSYCALGTDTGGSVRIPASYMGIVGMKPTFGRVSKCGVFSLAYTLDHVGPMTRSVKDNALLLNVLVGDDRNDIFSLKNSQKEDFTRYLNKDIKNTCIGVLILSDFVEEEVCEQYEKSIRLFEQLGASIRFVEIEDYDELLVAFRTTLKAEAYHVHAENIEDYNTNWDFEVKERILSGKNITAQTYIEAQLVKRKMIQMYMDILSDIDILITPTVPIVAKNVNQRTVQINNVEYAIGLLLNYYTGPLNLTGFPALSLPIGKSRSGLPIGLQIIGKPLSEATIYQFAQALEKRLLIG